MSAIDREKLLAWATARKYEAGLVRTEVLWINPVMAEYADRQLTLF